jgi:branched-chain amino acid transport system ATP-binding protein
MPELAAVPAVAPMLEVRNLMVFYENALAVNDLAMEVREGEVVGVFGSNSAGKTTLLNTIAGLTLHLQQREQRKGGMRITMSGRLLFRGHDIAALSPRARVEEGIILCRERHPVFKDNTVEENLRLGGYLRPDREVRDSIDEVYQIFPPVLRCRKRKAGLLSGGEKEMVAIGMALVAKPKLLLMDEPLLGLSPHMQGEVVRGAKEISRRGVTILMSEQYARPIMPIIDRGYVIENGSLVVSGTGPELMENPEVKSAYFGA